MIIGLKKMHKLTQEAVKIELKNNQRKRITMVSSYAPSE